MSLKNTWLKEVERGKNGEKSKKKKKDINKRGWKSFKFLKPKVFSELNGLSIMMHFSNLFDHWASLTPF